MPKYEIHLQNRREVAAGAMEFRFDKPAGFTFKAGQNADFTLLAPPETDKEGNKRTFSLVSAPYERQLAIATRMRDTAFKRSLKTLPLQTKLELDGPYGSMTLHSDADKPAVFLAGGIGITPFMAILKQARHEQKPHRIFLFYSNRRPEDAAFLEELRDLQTTYQNFSLIATMTEAQKSAQPWSGETGYIDQNMLQKYLSDLQKPVFYLAGPAVLVTALRDMLAGAGINEDNIRSEDFSGY